MLVFLRRCQFPISSILSRRVDSVPLHQRLLGRLRNRYEIYQRQLQDDFDDVLADFFLYLRDGKEGRNTVTYLSLRCIKSKDAFETWMLNTFRNYISVTANTKPPLTIVTTNLESESKIQNPDVSCSPLTDERKLAVASTLIAYAHQTSLPRDRFILLRTLLTLLNKQQAMPNEEMAEALGMSSVSYRVTVYRVKHHFAKLRTRLLQGETLPLDDNHLQMAQNINDDFTHLYPILYTYYCQTIDALASAAAVKRLRQEHLDATGRALHSAAAVKRLRQEHLDATGRALHETGSHYSLSPGIRAFWTMLSHLCLD